MLDFAALMATTQKQGWARRDEGDRGGDQGEHAGGPARVNGGEAETILKHPSKACVSTEAVPIFGGDVGDRRSRGQENTRALDAAPPLDP